MFKIRHAFKSGVAGVSLKIYIYTHTYTQDHGVPSAIEVQQKALACRHLHS